MDLQDLKRIGAKDLAGNEYWFINHAEGPLEETKSKNLTQPIIIICDALNMDWDDLRESGFWLDKRTFPSATADA